MLVEYKLITCLPKAFPFITSFSFSSRSTFSCAHWFLPPVICLCLLRYLNILVSSTDQHPCLVYQQYLQKKSSLFQTFLTLAIAFIKCLNCYHMRNNARYNGNINSTSIISFLISTLVILFTILFMF